MKILLFIFLFISVAHANVWDGNIEVQHDYACAGLDGIPIGNGSPLAGECCNDKQLVSNPPAKCKAGFQSITTDAVTTVAGTVTLSNFGLQTSGDMNGNNQDGSGTIPNIGGTTAGTAPGEGVASVAGGSSAGGDGSGTTAANSAAVNGGGGRGAGVGGSAGGGSGLGLGTSGGTSGLRGDPNDPNNQKANSGGYVKGGGSTAGGSTAGGMFGGMFGGGATSGGNGAGVGAGGPNELAFGEGGDTAGGATAGGDGSLGEDGEGNGSAEDPSDYFNRIDRSANIFKIVSARYMKKKSLWAIPQKLPEELKSKGI